MARRIDYTLTKGIEVAADVLERHRVAAVADCAAADAFRLLRTRMLLPGHDNKWRTVGITSPNKGAGTTTVALNLAVTVAMEIDYTALLVDANLRYPSVHSILGIEPGLGLADYLQGDASLNEVLIHPKIGDLVLLPGSTPAQNSSELLSSLMMVELIAELRLRYSDRLIFFDLPPVLSGADTLALSLYLDATVLIVEEGKTTPDEICRACDLLRQSTLLGIVLNKSHP